MTERHILTLTKHNRHKAHQGVDCAPDGWVLELRQKKRSDEQNRALWGAIGQIQNQRPVHNRVKMTKELWRFVFMDALGSEMKMLPKIDGEGFFAVGHQSSKLTKDEFAALLTIIIAWCAKEGIVLDHFDEVEA